MFDIPEKERGKKDGRLEEQVDRMQIIQSLSEIYTSVYYIDLGRNYFTELSSMAEVHEIIGATGNAQERLNFFCHHMMTAEYTQEMLDFVNLSTLDERLIHSRIISKQYLSTVFSDIKKGEGPEWTQCSFIVGDRDEQGKLAHVIFATQSIHAAKIQELEAKKKLEQTNRELTALLEEEKKHTAIIGSLSSIFFALFYIDLEENSFQEIGSLDNSHHVYGEKEDPGAALKEVVDTLVAGECRSSMRFFTDMNTIDERLMDKPIIIQEYTGITGGWYRCSIISVEKNNAGRNTKSLCGFRNIAAEKEALETQDNLIQALAMAYENVYAVNMDTEIAISFRMGQTISDRYGKEFVAGNYGHNMQLYVANEVLEEDRYLFDQISSVKGVKALLADQTVYSVNYRVLRDGKIQYFQCQIVKPKSDRNEFAIAFKDIDALVEAERKHAKIQEEQLRIIDALSQEYHSLFKINSQTKKISLYRTDGIGMDAQRIEKLMEAGDYDDIISLYIDMYVMPEDRDRLKACTGLQVLLNEVPEVGLYKIGYRRNLDGVCSYYEMNIAKIVDDSQTVIFIMGLRNVNEEMQRQLKQAKDLEVQNEIIEGLGSEYYSVLLVNPRTDKVTTFRAQDEDGRAIAEYFRKYDGCWSKGLQGYARELVTEESRSEFLEKLSLDHIRTDGEDYSFTYEKRVDDGVMYLQARVSFVREKEGSYVAVVGTRNVDDLIKKERMQEMALQAAFDAAEAANKAKTDFLSNMSHDIRTPMNGIIGMTAIAATHVDDRERVLDSLQKITQASKHLLSLINEVLDMSKIESGKVELVEEEFNLSDLVDNLLSMTNAQIAQHHHELSVNISGVTHEKVIGDSLRIQKVFTNLMGNAVKFTPDGGKISLSITERPSNQEKVGCYEFVFKDNGIGMSEEFQRRIFEPFSRALDKRVNKIQGTGLGMTISRNIVRMMGGDIKVESKLGEGSRFTVTMYLKLQDTDETNYGKFIDLNVLVADDDTLSLESCCLMLNDFGMRADGVSTGTEAVEKIVAHHIEQQDYFACIIDWKMPDMDGIETTRAIRKAVGADVPIIIISAYDWSDIEQEARAAGANAFISKPLFRSRLARTFSSLVGEETGEVLETPFLELERLQLSGRRALLVEDNELNAEIASEILGVTGIAIEHAQDGTEAVDMVFQREDGYYDIIFMDIQMPRMNGYDATRAIRAMDKSYCKKVPIVAMTANAFAKDVLAAKTVGMNEHIAKPLDLKILVKTLEKWLL